MNTKQRKNRSSSRPKKDGEVRVESMFMDSGAHGLFTQEVLSKRTIHISTRDEPTSKEQHNYHNLTAGEKSAMRKQFPSLFKRNEGGYDYSWYETDEFWKYVDDYAEFIKKNLDSIDFYVNVDAIFNPKITWKAQKYMEDKHGLRPLPVIHYGTDLKWIKRYIKKGYDFIGLGGLGQTVSKQSYLDWADAVYDMLCDNPKRLPCVKTHGFAMTSFKLMRRYPWWSVDSASWVKSGGFGKIWIPKKRNGTWDYKLQPHNFFVSDPSTIQKAPKASVINGEINKRSSSGEEITAALISESVDLPVEKVRGHLGKLKKDGLLEELEGKTFRLTGVPLKVRRLNTDKKRNGFQSLTKTERKSVLEWLDFVGVPVGEVDSEGNEIEYGIVGSHLARKEANIKFFFEFCKSLPEWPWPFRQQLVRGEGFFPSYELNINRSR